MLLNVDLAGAFDATPREHLLSGLLGLLEGSVCLVNT